MFKYRGKVIVAAIMLLVLSLACGISMSDLLQPFVSAEVSPPVTVSKNPKPNELLNCAVTQNLPDQQNDWVKFSEEYYLYPNFFEKDDQGRMWVATDGHGLLMFDGQEWHNWWHPEDRPSLSGDALRTMAVSETHVYAGSYASSAGGNLLIYDIENDQWQTIAPGVNALRANIIGGLAISPTGQIYAVTLSGLDILDAGGWNYASNPFKEDFRMHIVKDALFDSDGNYWIASDDGIFKYDGSFWTSYSAANGRLPSNYVNALALDQDGRIWAATERGLVVFSSGKWFTFSADEFPWYQGWLTSVAVDSQNRIWVLKQDVLSVYNGEEAILLTPDSIGENLWDDAVGFDQDGCVWVDKLMGFAVFQGKLDLGPGNYDFLK